MNNGVSVARNLGIKKSTGEYLSFVDADDYVEKDFLKDLVNGMTNEVDLSIIGVTHVYPKIPQKNNMEEYYEGIFYSSKVLNFLFFEHGPQGYLPNKLWRRSVIIKNNIFLDPTLSVLEDAYFTVEYLLSSRMVNIQNNKDYNYVHMGETLTSGMSFTKKEPNYSYTYKMMIKSVTKMLNLVSKRGNKENKEAILLFLAKVYRDYLRHLLVYGKILSNKKNNVKYHSIRKQLFRLKNVIFKNRYLKKKQRAIFFCTMYTPIMMKIVDNLRKSDK